jgi:D-alanine transaminase
MNALPDVLCYLNGEYLPLRDAKVSVMDRGFIFGDGVYEAIPVYGRRLFRFREHMARLRRSLSLIRMTEPLTEEQWLERCRKLIAAHPAEDQLIYLQVTRGVAPRDHVMPTGVEPTVFMMSGPTRAASAEQRERGVACVTAQDFRWERGQIKTTSLLGNVLARQISADAGAVETIMFRQLSNGMRRLTEASASNVWVVKDGAVFGVPKNEQVLEGVRFDLLQELCREEGITYSLRAIDESEVRAADELLLSSATKEILPVTRLDGQAIGRGDTAGRPGTVYRQLFAAYQQAKAAQSI